MFKGKIFNRVLFTSSLIVTLFIIAKLSGVLQYAFVTSSGNEPTIKRGSFIFMSNALPYEKFKMIAYNQNNVAYPAGVYVQRLIGVGGDEVLIKNGDLYVNDELMDKIDVKQNYRINKAYADDLILKGIADDDIYQINSNDFLAHLSGKELNSNFFYEKFIDSSPNEGIYKAYHKAWNADNFGPVVVPKGKLFFLGDSRNTSIDSRFLGFVDENDIVGRVFYPKN